ncbi:MAG: CidA/LrgA family protein [Firmicutes bacterium]|nr:CidA/LrgA family protein [Bacillota bacterium]
MKYIYQLFIIMLVTFAGEMLHHFIPIPVPASIYGLIVMLILLCTKIIKLENIEKTSDFLIEIMPLMFIPGGAGLITAWGELKGILLPVSVITVVSTVAVMAVTGKVTELVMKFDKRKRGKENERRND